MAYDFQTYAGVAAADAADVARGLEEFQAILAAYSPTARGFTDFRYGVIDQREGYKLEIHAIAQASLTSPVGPD